MKMIKKENLTMENLIFFLLISAHQWRGWMECSQQVSSHPCGWVVHGCVCVLLFIRYSVNVCECAFFFLWFRIIIFYSSEIYLRLHCLGCHWTKILQYLPKALGLSCSQDFCMAAVCSLLHYIRVKYLLDNTVAWSMWSKHEQSKRYASILVALQWGRWWW